MPIRTGEDAKRYRRWHNSVIRDYLRNAAQGEKIRGETLDRLELPKRQRKAMDEAIRLVAAEGHVGRAQQEADRLSHELLDSMPDWEEPDDRRQRRAMEGDPEAMASLKAEREAKDAMVDRILGDKYGGGL